MANPDKVRAQRKRTFAKRNGTIRGKLNTNMHSNIYQSIIIAKSKRKWESLVGYTVAELKEHLEKQFESWMSWDNYGKYGWHIDHKIPVSAFNFEKPEDIDFKKCWALKNLQPLAARENIKKGNKLNKPFQPSLTI